MTPTTAQALLAEGRAFSAHEVLEAVLRGTEHPEVKGVNVEVKAALSAGPADVLAADGISGAGPASELFVDHDAVLPSFDAELD